MMLTEGDLQIDFPDAVDGRKFDGPDHGLSHCMKAVDFIVELPDHYLFVEVKDPQHPRATLQSRNNFVADMRSGRLDKDLKYKYRDSFLYEWAMGRVWKPIEYRVLISLDTLDDAQLLSRKDSLARNLPQWGLNNQPWPRPIVDSCNVFNLHHPARRRP